MSEAGADRGRRPIERPLSPHLEIYKPMLTTMMSITHRISGGALYVGMLLLAFWLVALASDSDQPWDGLAWFLDSFFGKLMLFVFTWALFHHLMGGLRHFVWDTGRCMDDPEREYLALGTLAGGLGLTILIWIAYFLMR